MLKIQFILLLVTILGLFYNLIKPNHFTREFKINKHLKLKLEGGRTNIYVKNRHFRQCMYLLLNIPVDQVEYYDDIESIDEAAEKLDRSMENSPRVRSMISPEEEFMGHCSNLQVWAENGYDTRILHRNLAFPLLKRLTEVGDPVAKKVFKEEIAMRYASGHPTVINFLTQNGYLRFLNTEEFESILEEHNPPIFERIANELKNLSRNSVNVDLKRYFNYLIKSLSRDFGIHNLPLILSHLIKEIPINFRKDIIKQVFDKYKSTKNFPLLQFFNKHLDYFDEIELDLISYENRIIGIFEGEKLYLQYQNIKNIENIEGLKDKYRKIKELDLSNNQISDIKGLEKFSNLEVLKLNNNKISKIEELSSLTKLQELYLRNNKISKINGIEKLQNLHSLDLSNNITITKIPEAITKISSLKNLRVWNCNIKIFSKETSRFFWENQNYRFYKGYTQKDTEYYEKTHKRKAHSDNKLYKHFIGWLLKMRDIMKKYRFTYEDIEKFENELSKNAIWSGKPTTLFKKWLFNKNQTRITNFL